MKGLCFVVCTSSCRATMLVGTWNEKLSLIHGDV